MIEGFEGLGELFLKKFPKRIPRVPDKSKFEHLADKIIIPDTFFKKPLDKGIKR